MVLDKESSILGYPGEISKSLNADHHDVCKYISREDANYVGVRNALQTLARNLQFKGMLWTPRQGALWSFSLIRLFTTRVRNCYQSSIR